MAWRWAGVLNLMQDIPQRYSADPTPELRHAEVSV
jgi:hypothetical protein